MVSHGKNVENFAKFISDNQRLGPNDREVRIDRFVNYCGIAKATIKNRSLRLRQGGQSYHLKNNAAQNYLLESPLLNQYSYVKKSIDEANRLDMFDRKCKFMNQAVDLRKSLSQEQKFDLFALFKQSITGDCKYELD